ncbi:LicD family protein [Microbulbifer agarilyticus]|uniref:glycerophosphodiester phosphodiesterase family protein n=1 Tax=Microbulbifer agarilyticus TaxID=260552 RepID=UPI001C987210|nr:glycerophosphodiester phosphodiesterase family protein [Microbulbifer agarilyticus]MBY6190510.1 LicD family protein [Microbulbifer agarilyticus]
MKTEIAFEVFENLGVWGLDGTPLEVVCGENLSELELYIDSGSNEFLNMQAVEVIGSDDRDLIHSDLISSAELTSNYYLKSDGSCCVKARLMERRLIHSKFQVRPTLKIKFKECVTVRSVRLFNRADSCGLRSRFVALVGRRDDDVIFTFENVSESLRRELYEELMCLLSKSEGELSLPRNSTYAAKYLRSKIYDAIKSGVFVSEKLLAALLPVAGPMPRLDKLSAHYLTKVIHDRLSIKSHINTRELKKYSGILCDDVSIDCLSKYASKAISNIAGEENKVVIAKHRVHYDTLISKKAAHLDFLDKILLSLEDVAATPLIAYGTLLGAYRDGGFLPADDDIDIILYCPDVVSEEDRQVNQNAILKYLRDKGFSANVQAGCPHITVNSSTDSVGVDIFLAWGSATSDKAAVVMERLEYRDIRSDVLLPASEISLYGRSYPCPADVEEFLFDRYGEGWRRSNPYHEWSWPIERRVYFNNEAVSELYDAREARRGLRFGSSRTQLVAWSQCVLKNNRPPSNSIPMVSQALDYGYDVIELDVRVTKDGEIVLAHDDVIKNDEGVAICLSESTLAEAEQFRLGSFEGNDVHIETLSNALSLLIGKQVLLDARFKPEDYANLKQCVDSVGFDPSMLLFCVYNEKQVLALMKHFPESLWFWKFYTQAWEIDELALDQVRQYGVDGIMFMYPHHDEDISESLYQIKRRNLKSMCFIHGQKWTHPNSCGLSPDNTARGVDIHDESLKKMVAVGIEYVTTTECRSGVFSELVSGV